MPGPKSGQDTLDQIIAEMTAAETVDDAAIAFIQGVPAMIQAAVDAALQNGATEAQLQPVADLGVAMQAKTDALTAALQPPPPSGN